MIDDIGFYLLWVLAAVVNAAVVWIALEKQKPLGYLLLFVSVMIWAYVTDIWEGFLTLIRGIF